MKIIKTRIFKILILALIVGFVLGIISFILISKKGIKSEIINYINLFKTGKFNYSTGLVKSLFNNLKYGFLIWIFGIIFIFSFLSLLLVAFKGITLGFTVSSVIYTFGLKGVLYSLILSLNSIISIIIYIFLCYYSLNFSIKSYNAFRNNRQINYKTFFINYIYIFLILSGALILNSLFEIYISSNIIKFVV